MSVKENLLRIKSALPDTVTLVAVSKTKSPEVILEAYDAGQVVFGENKIQEMVSKWEELPKDIQWHMIGHVQRNKVKYMAPFVSLIHGVDSLKLLKEINKQAHKNQRTINCLFQIHIAEETTKFGLTEDELTQILDDEAFSLLQNINIQGVMGMASFTDDQAQIEKEFKVLKSLYDNLRAKGFALEQLSMGMSGDYALAIKQGSNMIRVGSAIFGARNYLAGQ